MLQPISGCVLAYFTLRFSLFHVAFQPISRCVSACFAMYFSLFLKKSSKKLDNSERLCIFAH